MPLAIAPGVQPPLRATFIVDPDGTVRWVGGKDLHVGRETRPGPRPDPANA